MDLCRLRVVGGGAAADVAIPAEVPVADVLPDLVELVTGGRAASVAEWALVHPVRGPLRPASTLASAGIVDGAVLLLSRASTASTPAVVVEDVPEAVGEALAAHSRPLGRPAAWSAAGALVAGGAGVVAVAGLPRGAGALVVAAVAAACSAVAIPLGHVGRTRPAGTALASGALAWWALAGAALGHRAGLRAEGVIAAAAVGVVIGSLLALLSPGAARAAAGALVAGVAVGAQVALLGRDGHSDVPVASVAVPVLLVLVAGLPAAVPALSGLHVLQDGGSTDRDVDAGVRRGRALQAWLLGGLVAGFAPAAAVLAVDGRWSARLLVLLAGLALAARSRRCRFVEDLVPSVVAALALLVGLAASMAAGSDAATVAALAAAVVAAGLTLAAGALVAPHQPTRTTTALARSAEIVVLAACVPIALAAGGVFSTLTGTGG